MHYKFLKKIVGVLGYKIIDKNLVKNERLISDYSYLTLNKILNNLFTENKINSIVQIGSNDGKRFDPLNHFIKKFRPFTLFVEPIESHFEDLKKNYADNRNVIFENSAISVNDEIYHLYKVKDTKLHLYDDHVLGITSFEKNHLRKHGIKTSHIENVKVNFISIKELLKKHSIKNFDLLYIDTEGYDAKIVCDFLKNSNIRPNIIFEYIHSKNDNLRTSLELLKKNNFSVLKIEENIFCFPKEKGVQIF